MHKITQELQSNDDSLTDDMLILVSQKFEEDKGLCLGNDNKSDKTDEILYKKQNRRMAVQLLASQKSEENQGWYLGNDNTNNEINGSLCLTPFVYVCFYRKGFYHCNQDHYGMHMIFL